MYSFKTLHLAEKRRPDHPPEHPSLSQHPRHASTPSSSYSLPSTPSQDHGGVGFYQAHFEPAMRLKDAWAQLVQRYTRPLDDDDVIGLRE
ncbi:hypothetical protein BJV78DRAFT_1364973 [Lactifluus subvellereus]|nr:hypothetical protein BJV78DRAFT_1364973 [Lactifluus subvellereus]